MKKFRMPESEPAIDNEDEGEEELDPVPALLAGLLLCMSCPECDGTGTRPDGNRCACRSFCFQVATATLKDEGLIQ